MKLTTVNLTKRYRRGHQEFDAVHEANITLREGEMASIVGPSGCGKSTLLSMISGMITPSSGQIFFDEQDLTAYSGNQWSDFRNRILSYIPQGSSLLNNFSVLDNICMPLYLSQNKKDARERAVALLEKVGLQGAEHEFPPNLSGGELRRVTILRSLINKPKILIADEPTSSLDPHSAKIVMEVFKEISHTGVGVLISTHDHELLNYSDRIYRMNNGQMSPIDKL